MATRLVCVAFIHGAYAAAVTSVEQEIEMANGNKSVLNEHLAPSWATTSNVRSSSDLLWTATLTLSLCVYTVIHINVPPPDKSIWWFILCKTKWVLVAMIAPELALATAYLQWETARILGSKLRKLRFEQNGESQGKEPASSTRVKHGMTYGFYVAMGGFVVDVRDIHNHLELVTILPQGVLWLAERGHFIDLSKKDIQDKSKADALAKSLVCIQVTWLVIQCIGRKAKGLPIALLEIHVLVHVVCALCLYFFWAKVSCSNELKRACVNLVRNPSTFGKRLRSTRVHSRTTLR